MHLSEKKFVYKLFIQIVNYYKKNSNQCDQIKILRFAKHFKKLTN